MKGFIEVTTGMDRIRSLSERYIQAIYAFGRMAYWDYEEDYLTIKA